MPKVYGYVRVSTVEQRESGLGIEAQHLAIEKIGYELKDPWGTERFPDEGDWYEGFFMDECSAYNNSFNNRPAAKKLLTVLQPGDTLIVSRLDRLCRNAADFCRFIELAKKNGWRLIFGQPNVDTARSEGIAILQFFSIIAEWESRIKSERIKAALAAKGPYKRGARRKEESIPEEEDNSSEWRPDERRGGLPSTGKVYIYTRVSHKSSVQSGLGLQAQNISCLNYSANLIEANPALETGGTLTDGAVSALSYPLASRPAGKQLTQLLKSGDHVIVQKPDRVFGTTHDFINTVIKWDAMGVSLHFADLNVNTGDFFGRCIVSVLVAFAEFERHLASMRNKEMKAVLASKGKYIGGGVPPFWKLYSYGGKSKLVLDPYQIGTFALLDRYVRSGMKQKAALEKLEKFLAKREGRPAIPACGAKRLGVYCRLPELFIPDKNGNVFPYWTKNRYVKAKKTWQSIRELWANKKKEERESIKLLNEKLGMRRGGND